MKVIIQHTLDPEAPVGVISKEHDDLKFEEVVEMFKQAAVMAGFCQETVDEGLTTDMELALENQAMEQEIEMLKDQVRRILQNVERGIPTSRA